MKNKKIKMDSEILRHEKKISIPTLIIQPEGMYWIAFIENNPSECWTGKSAGDALGHYFDRIYPNQDEIILKIIRRVSD